MTTVAFKAGIMASDSRVTGDYISGVQKLYRGRGVIVGIAGDLCAALNFVDWYLDRKKPLPPKATAGDLDSQWVALVATKRKLEYWDHNLRPVGISEGYAAIGSGAPFAIAAMDCGKSAPDAIKVAMRRDENSGGRVVTMHLTEPK